MRYLLLHAPTVIPTICFLAVGLHSVKGIGDSPAINLPEYACVCTTPARGHGGQVGHFGKSSFPAKSPLYCKNGIRVMNIPGQRVES